MTKVIFNDSYCTFRCQRGNKTLAHSVGLPEISNKNNFRIFLKMQLNFLETLSRRKVLLYFFTPLRKIAEVSRLK